MIFQSWLNNAILPLQRFDELVDCKILSAAGDKPTTSGTPKPSADTSISCEGFDE
jgi:hypothetical protein